MASAQADAVARSGAETNREVSDRHLLERFLAHRDEAAFGGLVERHGRTVWGVCRRVLRQDQDAEDAFQAVFLVLARKAASIRKGEAVGSWLYGVAYRTALRARQTAARRRECEKHATGALPEQPPWGEAACRELQRLLDEEVQRLADKYRAPFVLCCLEGLSKAEAARELGWKEGTVSGRLAEARKLLKTRLARRGVTFSAVLTAVALGQNTGASAAPSVLIRATVQAVLSPLAGQAAATLSPAAVALAEGLVKTMALAKVKAGLSLVLALTLLAGGVSLAAYHLGAAPAAVAPPAAADVVLEEPETFLPRPVPLVTPLDEQVLALAFSPDGTRLVTAGARPQKPGQLIIWDVATARSLVTIKGIPGVRTVVFSPDGQTLATGDFTGAIRLRDAQTGAERAVVKAHGSGVNGLAFSPDGAALASAGLDRTVKLWDVKELKERQVLMGHTDMVFSVAFFHHGRAVVSCGKDRTARIWDLATGKEKVTLQGHQEGIEMVAVSPDDKVVATASWDRTVRLWDAETGKENAVLEGGTTAVFAVAFSPDRKLLASASGEGTVRLWDVTTRKVVATLDKHKTVVWALAFSRDGKYLAGGSSDKTATLWDVAAAREVATLVAGLPDSKAVAALAYAPDGKVVGLATADRSVQLRDAKTGDLLRALTGHADVVSCLAFAPDGQTLASGSSDRTIKLWDRATGKDKLTLQGHTGAVTALAFTPDGKKLASAGDDKTIKWWDAVSGKGLASLPGHEDAVRALAVAPDGRRLASAGADRTVKVWDLTREAEPITLKGHEGTVRALAFAADGTLASAAEDGTVKLWEPAQGKERLTLKGHTGPVWALAFSPGGRTLVSGSQDTTAIVWDTVSGQSLQVLKGHQDAVTSLAYHPQGGQLLSGSSDTTVQRWQAAPSTPPALTLQGNPGGTWFAVYSPAGDRLATGGAGGTVTLWSRSLAPAQFPFPVRGGYCADVTFSPDGNIMAMATNNIVQLCDTVSAEVRRTLDVGRPIRCIAFSPDGNYLAVGTGLWAKQNEPSEVSLFEVATGREAARLAGHAGLTLHVRFSPDGKTLATTSMDKTVRLWDVPSGKPRATLADCGGPTRGTEFLPDGTLMTARLDRTLRFWDVADGRELKTWQLDTTLGPLAVSPDGTLLAGAEVTWASKGPALLRIWDLATGQVRLALKGHECRLTCLLFTPDGRGLVGTGNLAGDTGEIDFWELPSGRHRARFAIPKPTESLALRADGKRVASGSWAGLSLWDLDFVQKEQTYTAHTNIAGCGLFADGGKLLLTGSRDTTVNVWDVVKGERRGALLGHKAAIRALALAPDGQTLFTASEDTTVKLWDLATLTEKATLRGHVLGVYSLAVSPDGRTLASGGGDWGKPGPGELILWDLATGQQRLTLPGIERTMWSLAYSPDGTLLAGAGASGQVKVWDSATGQVRATFAVPHGRPLAFSPDGKSLAVGHGSGPSGGEPGAGGVGLWDTATWQQRAVLQEHQQVVFSVAFAPDGRTLASASQDGTIRLSSVPGTRGPAPIAVARQGKLPLGEFDANDPRNVPVAGGPQGTADVDAASSPETPDGAPRKPWWKAWVVRAEVLGLVLTLFLGVLFYLYLSRRAGKLPAPVAVPAPGPPTKAAAAPVHSFACSSCGKSLKARAELAGKRVKCPQCSKAVLVPGPRP